MLIEGIPPADSSWRTTFFCLFFLRLFLRFCRLFFLFYRGCRQVGETEAKAHGQEVNQMATYIMECGGMERIEQLQMHDNNNIYNKVSNVSRVCCLRTSAPERGGVRTLLEEIKRRFVVVDAVEFAFYYFT